MTPAELLGELSVKIYKPPLCDMWHDGRICDPSNPVAVLMLILGFDTEVSMNGINNFIGNSSGQFGHETVAALKAIGAVQQAALLDKILAVAEHAGMTHEAIQRDRTAAGGEYTVTSFKKLHGDKWDLAFEKICEIDAEVDYADLISHAEAYVQRHRSEIQKALDIAPD